MTARNSPCPCGSGKKFKFCHGAATAGSSTPAPPASAEKFRPLVNALIAQREPQQLQQAIELLHAWRELEPANTEALRRELEIHLFRGEWEKAESCLREWSEIDAEATQKSSAGELSYFQAVLQQLKGNTKAALASYSKAILGQRQSVGQNPLEALTLAVAAAIQLCETAAGNYPGSPRRSEDGMFTSGPELQELERALNEWEKQSNPVLWSSETKSLHGNAWYNLGCAALADFTADDRRITLFEKALALDPDHLLARSNLAFAYNYSPIADSQQIFRAHRLVGSWLENRKQPSIRFINRRMSAAPTRLRLGYLSSDFRQHSVAHFILPVLQQHDRQRFEVFVYHNHLREDALTHLAQEYAEHFLNVAKLSDAALADRITSDQIDILIDLNGLTGKHRLAMLSQRAAPVQLSWMGYPNTTGLGNMDFRVVDGQTDPPGQSEDFASETLLRLGPPFLSYSPPASIPEVSPAAFLSKGYITFGSFNALPKLNPQLLRSWAGILRELPQSRLLIKNTGMGFNRPQQQISAIFADQGVSPERLIFAGQTSSQFEHLQYYAEVDISLDTFPYNGTTTSCESLWMGVPVVSRAGLDHRSRVGLSILSALGLESLVGKDENSMIRIATTLANDEDQLRSLRTRLRGKFSDSRLADAAGLTQNLETELIRIREAWCYKELHEQ